MSPSPSPGPESRRDLAVLGALLVGCAVLAALPSGAVSGLTGALRASVLAPFVAAHETVEGYARLGDDLERLRAERDSLARLVARHRSTRAENRELREMAGLPPAPADSLVAVEVVPGVLRGGASRTFVLRGTIAGLRPPGGVFTHEGVVGVVRAVESGRAVGDFWTHPDFRVSVRTEDGSATGIVRPRYEGDQPGMLLEGAPYQETIAEGVLLVTTGLGGVFPAGVPVGEVVAQSGVESGWERSYHVRPRVRPAEVGVAFVRRGGATAPRGGPGR